MIEIRRNVMSTQAKATLFCLHVFDIAIYIGRRAPDKDCWHRLELFTPLHRLRFV